jgi:hypothetical protein
MSKFYTSLKSEAHRIARLAHEGQVDKGGCAYYMHAQRVANRAEDLGRTPVECALLSIIGVLHDVLEDCPVARYEEFYSPIRDNFPPIVMETLHFLKRAPGASYSEYIKTTAQNRLSRKVKMADLYDNLDPVRLASLPPEEGGQNTKRVIKYLKALGFLLGCREGVKLQYRGEGELIPMGVSASLTEKTLRVYSRIDKDTFYRISIPLQDEAPSIECTKGKKDA